SREAATHSIPARPLRGIVCVSSAGLAGLFRKSQIASFSPFRCTDFRVLGHTTAPAIGQSRAGRTKKSSAPASGRGRRESHGSLSSPRRQRADVLPVAEAVHVAALAASSLFRHDRGRSLRCQQPALVSASAAGLRPRTPHTRSFHSRGQVFGTMVVSSFAGPGAVVRYLSPESTI